MAKAWRNKSMTVELKGFDEFLEKLQEAGKNIDVEGKKCFEQACANVHDSLVQESQKAGLANSLVQKITENKIFVPNSNLWSYECGWKKQKPSTHEPLPDTYKVMFYNYGTPSARKVKEAGQRIMINGKWVTLGENRGQETAHGFIKKAKASAKSKNQKLFKDFLKEILGD